MLVFFSVQTRIDDKSERNDRITKIQSQNIGLRNANLDKKIINQGTLSCPKLVLVAAVDLEVFLCYILPMPGAHVTPILSISFTNLQLVNCIESAPDSDWLFREPC